MSIECMSWIWKHSQEQGPRLLLLLALADYANDRAQAWPSIKTLAHKARITERTCQLTLRSLEQSGAIRIEYNTGRGHANVYTVVMEFQETLQSATPIPEQKGETLCEKGCNPMSERVIEITPESSRTIRESSKEDISDNGKTPTPVALPVPKGNPRQTPRSERVAKRDPRTKTPAIQCAYAVAGNRYPPREIYDDVIRVLGEHPDGKRLAACRKAWLAHGHNPNSWQWLFDWYVSGVPAYARQAAGLASEPEVIRIVDTMRGGL